MSHAWPPRHPALVELKKMSARCYAPPIYLHMRCGGRSQRFNLQPMQIDDIWMKKVETKAEADKTFNALGTAEAGRAAAGGGCCKDKAAPITQAPALITQAPGRA